MRLFSVCSEAWRSILSGSSRCVLAILSITILVSGSSFFEISTSSDILHQADQYRNAGGNIMVLNASGGVNGQACERLSNLNGVQASGAIRESDQLMASALPDTKIPSYTVTPSFMHVLRAKQNTGVQGVFVSNELTKTLGLRVGDKLALSDGRQTRIRGTYRYPDDGRAPGYSYAVLSPVISTGTFDACWVSVWPQTSRIENAIWSALTPAAKSDKDSSITLEQLNSSLGRSFDGQSIYRKRPTAFLPIMAACTGAVLGYAMVRIRRLEIASALPLWRAKASSDSADMCRIVYHRCGFRSNLRFRILSDCHAICQQDRQMASVTHRPVPGAHRVFIIYARNPGLYTYG